METVSADRNVCVGWLDHDKCDGLQNRNRRLQRYYGFDKHILNGISQSGYTAAVSARFRTERRSTSFISSVERVASGKTLLSAYCSMQ